MPSKAFSQANLLGTDQLGTGDYTHSIGSQQAVCLNTADGDEFFVGNGLAVKTYAT